MGDKVGDRKEDCRGGDGGLVDDECLFLVRSLETEAVAWEVLASGKAAGAKSCGGGRVLELEVEFDTVSEQIRNPDVTRNRFTRTGPRGLLSLKSQGLVVHEDLPQ